ncbi:hypothetical protein BKA58DRAFT_125827 [Alternaria rosae]|uniref:uncharacterized protein n=1 Tax=Alternaria rosae TaxID=1187941 RepID=UPI001E8D93D2|nr:uncharacterized protein BKA58DRAFT_125827 [Alternaria rosae]KAH6875656.1 hypothetical protein BKA58DRAFT_125827 [Alternaria rosae]
MATAQLALDGLSISARPAEPLLASQLIGDQDLDELLESVCNVNLQHKHGVGKDVLQTRVKSLNDAFGSGIQNGRVVGVSGEAGAGGGEICCTLLASSLLQYENSTAAVVDTTGNFDVLRLYTLIVAQLSQRPDLQASLRTSLNLGPGATTEDLAAKVLDRVKIMRVFDFVGVREAIGEIRDGIEKKKDVESASITEEKEATLPTEEPVQRKTPIEKVPVKRTYVADSEDEEDDEEMLFDSDVTDPIAAQLVQNPEPTRIKVAEDIDAEVEPGPIKIVLIDNLTQVLNPLLKKDYIQANEVATTFLASLSNLTQAHALHTLFVNPALPPRASSPKRPIPQNQLGPLPPQQRREPPLPPSIFASNDVVPSLIHLLGRYTDMEVLVSRLPRRRMDAKVYYSNSGGKGTKRGVEMVSVLEIVSDRWGARTGAWGTFRESTDGIRDI